MVRVETLRWLVLRVELGFKGLPHSGVPIVCTVR